MNVALIILMIILSLWTVMAHDLIKSAIGLALVSAILTLLMFNLSSPLAAVFELSVCTGLITVVFVSVISLTKPQNESEKATAKKERMKRFWLLPILVIVVSCGVYLNNAQLTPGMNLPTFNETDVRNVLWTIRQKDMLGQIIMILVGVFGIVTLFKEAVQKQDEHQKTQKEI